MAYPDNLTRTKNWSTEILTDTDLESQLDLIIAWVDAFADETSGHSHDGTTNEGPKILVSNLTLTSGVAGDIIYHNGTNLTRLAKGTAGQSLVMNAGATAPSWSGYAVPSGVICMWSGSIASIPTGWVLCDGNNSTPNLTNRFIVCADADDGGVAKSTITGSALASHDTGLIPAHTHTVTLNTSNDGGTSDKAVDSNGSGSDRTENTGSYGTGTKVIPVFYALAYIMKS